MRQREKEKSVKHCHNLHGEINVEEKAFECGSGPAETWRKSNKASDKANRVTKCYPIRRGALTLFFVCFFLSNPQKFETE